MCEGATVTDGWVLWRSEWNVRVLRRETGWRNELPGAQGFCMVV